MSKRPKSKASSAAAAEMLGSTAGGGFGSSFGAGFGSAFGAGFGSAFPSAEPEDASEERKAEAPAATPISSADPWSAFLNARSHAAPAITDAALVLALKQLSKRDPVTRRKALDTLAAEFTQMDASMATHVLPGWLLAQERLHLDGDRRVREAAWTCFGVLREKSGKNFAALLKLAFPLWWTHRCDPCKEVARAAQKEWLAAFPAQEKQRQVLVFCSKEYFAYLTSLFAQTPVTLSDQTIYSVEESAERWERATSSALTSLAEFIDLAPSDENSVSLSAYTALLSSSTLSRFASSRVSSVRRALYTVLKSLLHINPHNLVSQQMATLSPLILGDLLEEQDRMNQQGMLEVVLTFAKKFGKEPWETLSIADGAGKGKQNQVQTVFYPRLKKLLQTGLGGNYTTVYPCVLPLLSLLPHSVQLLAPSSLSSMGGFFDFFFGTLWSARLTLQDAGGGALSLSGSSKELGALLDAYFECLLWLVHKRGKDNDTSAQQYLISKHLLSACLTPALHFASPALSPQTDPSLTVEAIQSNRFGKTFYEKAGKCWKEAIVAVKDPQFAQTLWEQLSRACVDALQSGSIAAAAASTTSSAATLPSSAVSDSAGSTTSVAAMAKRRAGASIGAAPVDEYTAISLFLGQQDHSATSASYSSLLRLAGGMFEQASSTFAEVPITGASALPALRLTVQIVDHFGLEHILTATSAKPNPSSYLTSTLLPLLRQLLIQAGNASENDSGGVGEHQKHVETVELFARGLLAKAIEVEATSTRSSSDSFSSSAPAVASSTDGINTATWDELLQLVSSAGALSAHSLSSSRAHVSLLRVLFVHLFAKSASVHGHPALQDLIVTQAETLLTCSRESLLHDYAELMITVLKTPGLLSNDVLVAVIGSFLEAATAYQSSEEDLLLPTKSADSLLTSREFVAKLQEQTGCTVEAVPSIIAVLGSLLSADTIERLCAGTDTRPDTLRTQIVTLSFWFQSSPLEAIAVAAGSVWGQCLDRNKLKDDPRVLIELAQVFRKRAMEVQVEKSTGEFIDGWSQRLEQLFNTLAHPAVQQKILDTALPSHAQLRTLLWTQGDTTLTRKAASAAAERLRIIRDLISQLVEAPTHTGLTPRVLFLGESIAGVQPTGGSGLQWEGQPRLTLRVDLLAIQSMLAHWEQSVDSTVLERTKAGYVALRRNPSHNAHEVDTLSMLRHFHQQGAFANAEHCASMVKTLLIESQAVSTVATAKTATSSPSSPSDAASAPLAPYHAGAAYTAALSVLLPFLRSHASVEAHKSIRTLLAAFLTSITVDQIRSHTHSALPGPFERTVLVVLEGAPRYMSAKDAAALTALGSLVKWTTEGVDAGVRMLAKSNDRLFALASLLRIEAALLPALKAIEGGDELLVLLQARVSAFVSSSLNLFTPLSAYSVEASRFFAARSMLLSSLVQMGELPLETVQTALLWCASVVKFAVNQHAAAVTKDSVVHLDYLATTFHLAAILIAPPTEENSKASDDESSSVAASPGALAFLSSVYPLLLSSPLLHLLSTRSSTALCTDMGEVVTRMRETRPERIVELVRNNLRAAGGDTDQPATAQLFLLLSHPQPGIALSVLHFLSLGLLDRAICTPIRFEVDEAEEMRAVLQAVEAQQQQDSKKKKKRRPANLPDPSNPEEVAQAEEQQRLDMEHQKKTMKDAYQRQLTQQRVDQLLPHTLQRILHEGGDVNEEDTIELDDAATRSDDLEFFSGRPVALQLRGQLLSWSVVLDLLSQSLPASAGTTDSSSSSKSSVNPTLSDSKLSLLVTFLRESDIVPSFLFELSEHILVTQTESQVSRFVLREVKAYEHRQQKLERQSSQTEEADEKVEPNVVVEDEDEEGNIIPSTASSSAPPATSTPAPPPAQKIREYPLSLHPSFLLPVFPQSTLPKVLPYCMRRLMGLRKRAEREGAELGEEDETIYFSELSCLLYLRTLRVLPALSRSWFTNIDRSNGAVISRLTASSFSPLLIQDELLNVDQHAHAAGQTEQLQQDEDDQFIIRTNYAASNFVGSKAAAAAASVVYAKFVKGEIVMSMSIKLPAAYPLLPVVVTLDEKVAVKEAMSKKWTLAIQTILASSDGSLYDAIGVWRKNLESHFSGAAECSICMVSSARAECIRKRCSVDRVNNRLLINYALCSASNRRLSVLKTTPCRG